MKPTAIPSATANHLGPEIASLWALCDGTRTVAELAAQTGWPRELVWQRLDRLADAGLLAARVTPPTGVGRDSRRQVLRRLTAAAGLAPAAALAEPITLDSPTGAAALSEQDKKEGRAKIDAANDKMRLAEEKKKFAEANQEAAEKRSAAEEKKKLHQSEDKSEERSKEEEAKRSLTTGNLEQEQKASEEARKLQEVKQMEERRKRNIITDDDVQFEQLNKASQRNQNESDAKTEESGKAQETRNKDFEGAQENENKVSEIAKEEQDKQLGLNQEQVSKKFDFNQEQSAKLVYPVSLLDVPEPQSWTLVGLALVGAAALRARSGRPTPPDTGSAE